MYFLHEFSFPIKASIPKKTENDALEGVDQFLSCIQQNNVIFNCFSYLFSCVLSHHWFSAYCRTNLMKLRSEYKDAFVEKHGVKLGLMSGFIKVHNVWSTMIQIIREIYPWPLRCVVSFFLFPLYNISGCCQRSPESAYYKCSYWWGWYHIQRLYRH
jgi:hypothetical protein